MRLPVTTSDRPTSRRPTPGARPLLHRHLSRRTFLSASAGAAGFALGSGLLRQLPAGAAQPGTGEPSPIPGGIQPVPGGPVFHIFLPGEGSEPSTITDFNGAVGVSVTQGTWTATGTPTGGVSSGVWEADMRFMKGLFVGTDGRRRQGAFGFV
jgi:hypothetical protein